MYRILTILFVLIATVSACTDKLTFDALEGTYTGQFYYISPEDTIKRTGPASVSFTHRSYTSQGNPDKIPAGGSGPFEILGDDLLDFKDQNVWTANFDWGLILNGKYKYRFRGDSLILTRYTEPCSTCIMAPSLYQYRLKRIN